LRRIDIGETIRRFLYGARFGEVTRKALSVVGLFLAGIRHVGCDIYQTYNRWIRTSLRDYSSSVAVGDKNARPILLSKDALRGSHVIFKGRLRLLHDADVEAVVDKDVVNTLPAGTIRPGSVHQHDILYRRVRCLGHRVVHHSKGAHAYEPCLHVVRDHKTSLMFKSLRKISFGA